jgi:hypothetical protein
VVIRHLPKFAIAPWQIGNEDRNTSSPSFNKKSPDRDRDRERELVPNYSAEVSLL